MAKDSDLGARLGGSRTLLQRSLRRRVEKILEGTARPEDFRSLFLDLRFRTKGRARFRDVADFIAHSDLRDRGQVAELVRDIYSAARVFNMILSGIVPSPAEARAAAHANLRLTTDDLIASYCAKSRKAAAAAIDRATDALNAGLYPSASDVHVFNTFANRLKWHPAFLDHELLSEFLAVLTEAKLIRPGEEDILRSKGPQLSLFVLVLLHGSEVEVGENDRVVLQAGFFNDERRLEVKAYLTFNDFKKPIYMPLAVFLTDMQPEGHCASDLIASEPHGWDMPLHLTDNWCLAQDA